MVCPRPILLVVWTRSKLASTAKVLPQSTGLPRQCIPQNQPQMSAIWRNQRPALLQRQLQQTFYSKYRITPPMNLSMIPGFSIRFTMRGGCKPQTSALEKKIVVDGLSTSYLARNDAQERSAHIERSLDCNRHARIIDSTLGREPGFPLGHYH